jgi:hypothetical protein
LFLVVRIAISLRQTLDRILALTEVHDGDTGNLSYPTLEIAIAGGDDITFVLHHTFNQTVISISSLVRTGQTLETGVASYPQCHFELRSQLFQFSHDTIRNAGDRFSIETIHHALDKFDFVLNRKVDKVGIDQDPVWRSKSRVVVEEHGRGDLRTIESIIRTETKKGGSLLVNWRYSVKAVDMKMVAGDESLHVTNSLLFLVFFLLLQLFLVCLEASVIRVDDALDESELLCGLCLALWN